MKRLTIPRHFYLVLFIALLCLILPPLLQLDPLSMDARGRLAPPSAAHWFGGDEYGRDLFARVLFGGRVSLGIAFAVSALSTVIALVIGLYSAVYTWIDRILMRVIDAMMSIPAILLALALMSVFSASAGNVVLALTLVYAPVLTRLVRGMAMKIKNEPFIEALRLAGQSESKIVWLHLMPNSLAPLFVQSTFVFADAIISEAALSFLGAGIPAKEASWGNIIASGKLLVMRAPHLILIPAFLIFIILYSLSRSGDRLAEQLGERTQTAATRPNRRAPLAAAPAVPAEPAADVLLQVQDLSLRYHTPEGGLQAFEHVSFNLRRGRVLALVGGSGCGKSSVCQTILRLHEDYEADRSGSVRLGGREIMGLSEKAFAALRGKRIAMVFQDPSASLDPVRTVRQELSELLPKNLGRHKLEQKLHALLTDAGLADPERVLAAYPHELSGGQKQRVSVALALAQDPEILLADEPTTALDVVTQKGLMELFGQLKARGLSILFVTHDLSLLTGFADEIAVMDAGRIIELAATDDIFSAPQHAHTQALLGAVLPLETAPNENDTAAAATVIELEHVKKAFKRRGRSGVFYAIDDVSFRIGEHLCTAVVGESASGKTTCARLIAGLLQPTSGRIRYRGIERSRLSREQARQIQLIFQNPLASFDPRQTIGRALIELEKLLGIEPDQARRERLLADVNLPAESLGKYPLEFSGGQAQRLAIARALLLNPDVLIFDESLSGLDVLVQQRILELLEALLAQRTMTFILISHDLRAVRALSDRVIVLEKGKLRDDQDVDRFFASPAHAYSRELLAAVPRMPGESAAAVGSEAKRRRPAGRASHF